MARKFKNAADDRNLHWGRRFMPYNKTLKQRARELRKTATLEERRVWNFLRTLPVRCYRQRVIDHYILDFYIPEHKLAIEIDGTQHYEEEAKHHDEQRAEVLSTYGIRVVRIPNKGVREMFDDVCRNILLELGMNEK